MDPGRHFADLGNGKADSSRSIALDTSMTLPEGGEQRGGSTALVVVVMVSEVFGRPHLDVSS